VVPLKAYRVQVERELVPIAVLPNVCARDLPAAAPVCAAEQDKVREGLGPLVDEVKVSDTVEELSRVPAPADCREVLASLVSALTTRRIDGSYDVNAGELVRVTVERTDDEAKKWTYVVTTGGRGEWHVSYGFTFVPNEDEEFFSRPQDDAFVVTQEADRENLDFAPSVMFNWLPAGQRARTWTHGFVGGLGFDLEKPVLFAGWGLTRAENIMLTAGLVIHNQSQLVGRYSEGEVLEEALEGDQLVEDTYGPNVYFGLSFRFGGNPHAGRAKALAEAAAAREAAASAKAAAAAAAKKAAEADALLRAACEADAERVKAEAVHKCAQGEADARDTCEAAAAAAAASAKATCPLQAADKVAADEAAETARETL
jgi:hypothetical protein